MTVLPTFLTIRDAAQKFGVEETRLRTMIEAGKIRAGKVNGEVIVSEEEVQKKTRNSNNGVHKEDLPEFKKFEYLKEEVIGLGEAASKYSIPIMTISGWVKKGIIRKLGVSGQKFLLNEQDVAYCSYIYKRVGKKGRILFYPDGTPYKTKAERVIK
jgi:predicted site-specific integrase-resolvase